MHPELDYDDDWTRPTRAEAEADARLNELYPSPPSGIDVGEDPWYVPENDPKNKR